MRFRELFEKYLKGEASAEEKEIVENEIEKNELISEHLAEKLDIGLQVEEGFQKDDSSMSREMLEKLQRAINRKFRRTILASVMIVILLLLGVKYGVSPYMDSIYYNPAVPRGEYSNKLMVDMAAFTELHFPGTITYHANSEALGYGSYDVKINQSDLFSGKQIFLEGKIEKGRMKYLQRDFYRYPYMNAFNFVPYHFDDTRVEYGDKDQLEELEKMPETAIAKVYLSFKIPLTIEELLSLQKEYGGAYFSWVAVMPSKNQPMLQLGFEPFGTGIVFEESAVDSTRYPAFELANIKERPLTAEVLETHFKTLLRYMADSREFLKLLELTPEYYGDALNYVEENGVKSYGVLVQGNCSEILKLREDPAVDSIMIDNIKLSSYTR